MHATFSIINFFTAHTLVNELLVKCILFHFQLSNIKILNLGLWFYFILSHTKVYIDYDLFVFYNFL
jgi:hypothetical protein